jgi:hypothetical protein
VSQTERRDPDTFHQVRDRVARPDIRWSFPPRPPDLEEHYVAHDQGFSVQSNRNGGTLDEILGLGPAT